MKFSVAPLLTQSASLCDYFGVDYHLQYSLSQIPPPSRTLHPEVRNLSHKLKNYFLNLYQIFVCLSPTAKEKLQNPFQQTLLL